MNQQSPKKKLWQYQFDVPNIGNDGKEYFTRYEFRIEVPSIADFEKEMTLPNYKVYPSVTLTIIQGNSRIKSVVPMGKLLNSPLYKLVSDSAKGSMGNAVIQLDKYITDIRDGFTSTYGIYYNNGTVYKGSDKQ